MDISSIAFLLSLQVFLHITIHTFLALFAIQLNYVPSSAIGYSSLFSVSSNSIPFCAINHQRDFSLSFSSSHPTIRSTLIHHAQTRLQTHVHGSMPLILPFSFGLGRETLSLHRKILQLLKCKCILLIGIMQFRINLTYELQ